MGDYLDAHGDDYEQVLCTDTRDVIFQGDVFESFAGYTNWLGCVTEYADIGKNTCNYDWLTDLFGQEEADKLSDKKIICSGTVLGTVNEMKIFCRELWKILQHKTTDIFDQGVMNYLVYNNLLPIENLFGIDCVSGEIFTCGLVKNNQIRGDKILREDGGVPAVVHQYDRHAELVGLVDGIYRDKNFQGDANFSDVRSVIEQTSYFLQAGKIDDAARFYMNNLTSGANFGGNIDRLLKIWQLVLQRPTTPAVGYLELAVQDALMNVGNFSPQQLNFIFPALIHSIKNQRTILPQFKIFVCQGLVNIVEQTIQLHAAEQCFEYLKIIEELTVPLDKNFYLLAAKANRIFGRKDAALAAYTKALELG